MGFVLFFFYSRVLCFYSVHAGAFSDEEIVHVEGEVDPPRDLQIIHDELRLKDMEYIRKHLEPLERSVVRGGGDKKKKEEFVRFFLCVFIHKLCKLCLRMSLCIHCTCGLLCVCV